LISLCPLVDVPDVRRDHFNAAHEGKNRFFKFLNTAVGDTDVVKDVRLVGKLNVLKWFGLQRSFERLNTLLVLFMSKVGQSHEVQD